MGRICRTKHLPCFVGQGLPDPVAFCTQPLHGQAAVEVEDRRIHKSCLLQVRTLASDAFPRFLQPLSTIAVTISITVTASVSIYIYMCVCVYVNVYIMQRERECAGMRPSVERVA